jgi:opacity protein-like surface antigen
MFTRSITRSVFLLLTSLLPAAVHGQADSKGFYVTGYGQFSRIGATTFTESGAQGAGAGLRAEFGRGLGGGGDVGYRFGNGWAAEIEWNYRTHSLTSLQRGGTTLTRTGDYASNILLINGLRRFASSSKWTPYVGAGVGFVLEIDLDLRAGAGGSSRAYSSSGRVAPQLIGGVEYALTRHWRLITDARWLGVGAVRADNATGNAGGNVRSPTYNPLSIQAGIRYRF